MGWTARNLTQNFPKKAFSRPSAYLFAAEQTRHVIYVEADTNGRTTGHLMELYSGPDDVWYPKDITDESDGTLATSDPSGYVFDSEGSQHVVYLSGNDGHIYELYQDDGWHANDLMESSQTVARAVNAPMGWASKAQGTQQVVFRGDDNRHIHLLSRGTGDGASWAHRNLTNLGGPTSALAPAGYSFEAAGTQHINVVGDDQLMHEYIKDASDWHYAGDLGPNVGASHDTLPQPTGYGFAGDGTRHVPWRGANNEINELSFEGGFWSPKSLTQDRNAPLPADGLPPVGYAFEANAKIPVGTRHVLFVGDRGIVYEFWHDPSGWHVNPLTGDPGFLPAASAPVAFTDASRATQNVYYRATTGDIVELRYKPSPVIRPGQPHPVRKI